jgi:DNA primase large subunit
MEQRHARYPVLDAAREAVATADPDLEAIAAEDAVVDRAVARIEATVERGTVGEPHHRPRVELFSYPIARVLVSLVDDPALVRAYAAAEAATAVQRLREDVIGDRLRSASGDPLTLDEVLAAVGLQGAVVPASERQHRGDGPPERFRITASAYLQHAPDGDDWRLVARDLDDGWITIDRDECFALLETAIQDRVATDLPLTVPEPVAASLDDAVDRVESALGAIPIPGGIDTVVPECFPDCIDALLDRAAAGEQLSHHAAFTLVGFLAAIGAEEETIVDRCTHNGAMDPEVVRRRLDRVRDPEAADPIVFAPPSCATMAAYDLVDDPTDCCGGSPHPLAAYESALVERGLASTDEPADGVAGA